MKDEQALNSPHLKYQIVTNSITMDIEVGKFPVNSRLPSFGEMSERYSCSRVTIERAYMRLKKEGYISFVDGKGFFVAKKNYSKLKVLLIFNKLSSYKKDIFDGLIDSLKNIAHVDFKLHHYNINILKEIIEENAGKYHYYVVMPHFYYDTKLAQILDILNKIPSGKLVILDKKIDGITGDYISVCQDFQLDIYSAFKHATTLFDKYKKISVIFPAYTYHPKEILEGINKFCSETNKQFEIINDYEPYSLLEGTAYVVIEEDQLARLIRKARTEELEPGVNIGIISFNETVLNELMDITVFTSDFVKMGKDAGILIANQRYSHVKNEFKVIKRTSL